MTDSMARREKPIHVAFVVCDESQEDPTSGKNSLIGILQDIRVPSFPFVKPKLCVYIQLVSGCGVVPVSVKMIHQPTGTEIIEFGLEKEFPGPDKAMDIYMDLTDVDFPLPGRYVFELFCFQSYVCETVVKAELGI